MEQTKHIGQVSQERTAGRVIVILGILMICSSLVINPWIGKYWRDGPIINFYDAMLGYFIWSSSLGVITITLGLLVARKKGSAFDGFALLVVTLAILILSDRLLLAKFGLPKWVHDPVIQYRNRPNIVRTWGHDYNNALFQTNRYGHYDDDFTLKKGDAEFRGVIVGDSIVMGHGVSKDDTFAAQLERVLYKADTNYHTFQIINTGVQGYSPWQEYEIVKESMVFDPDFVAIGFCMNDVTLPFVTEPALGGVGIDYHGIRSANALFGWFMYDTGLGRSIYKARRYWKPREAEALLEIYNVKNMAEHSVSVESLSESWEKAWRMVLADLEKMYSFLKERNVRVVLLVFPHTFQVLDENMRGPQRILREHARKHHVDLLDFTTILGRNVIDDDLVVSLRGRGFSYDEIALLTRDRIRKYWLDEDHLTVEGHRLVANEMYDYLRSDGLLMNTGGRQLTVVSQSQSQIPHKTSPSFSVRKHGK